MIRPSNTTSVTTRNPTVPGVDTFLMYQLHRDLTKIIIPEIPMCFSSYNARIPHAYHCINNNTKTIDISFPPCPAITDTSTLDNSDQIHVVNSGHVRCHANHVYIYLPMMSVFVAKGIVWRVDYENRCAALYFTVDFAWLREANLPTQNQLLHMNRLSSFAYGVRLYGAGRRFLFRIS